jgi:GAF domain-containing protein/HAMP domain-containing protein
MISNVSAPSPKPRQNNPFLRWWLRLSLFTKLVLPIAAGLLLAVVIFFVTGASVVNQLASEQVGLALSGRNQFIDKQLGAFFEATSGTLNGLARAYEIRNYIELVFEGEPNIDEARADAEKLLIAAYSVMRIPFADLRVLGLEGQQQARVRSGGNIGISGIAMGKESLFSEADSAFFNEIQGLPAGNIYFSAPIETERVAPTGGASTTEMAFDVAIGLYLDDELVGYLVGNLRPAEYLISIFAPFIENTYTYTSLLLTQADVPLIESVTNRTELATVELFGRPQLNDHNTPIEALSAPPLTNTLVGGRYYQVIPIDNLLLRNVLNANWQVVTSIAENDPALNVFTAAIRGNIVRPLFLFIGLIVVVVFVGQSFLRQLKKVIRDTERIASGSFKTRVQVENEDELGDLASAINTMTNNLDGALATLEIRVKQRTRNLEIAGEIGRDASRIRDIDELLQRTVNAIRERFGLYHAQVFLLNETRDFAVLVVGTGEAGRQMLERNHRLAVGSESVVGQATAKQKTLITLDTESSEVSHRYNPVLPLTRSEMAMPLMAGANLIGVLDLQSTIPNAFDQDDIQVFQLIADQLAVAIDNARLIREQQERVSEIDSLNRRLTRDSWTGYVNAQATEELAYRYDTMNVEALRTSRNGGGRKSGNSKPNEGALPPLRNLEMPIVVRGQQLGSINVTEELDMPLSPEDQAVLKAVSERVALALENVRLVEETQDALRRVEDLYQSGRALSATGDTNEIFRVAAERLARFPIVERVVVMLGYPTPSFDSPYLQMVQVWEREPNPNSPYIVGNYLPKETIVGMPQTPDPHPVEIVELAEIAEKSPILYNVLQTLGVSGFAFGFLATPNRWFGLIACQTKQREMLSETFLQYMNAITDQISNNLENRALFEEAQNETRRSKALARAAQAASQIGVDFETGVEELIRIVTDAADYDRWWLGLITLTGRGVVLKRTRAQFPAESLLRSMESVRLDIEQNAIAEATRKNELILINNNSHPLTSVMAPTLTAAYGKHLALPISVNNNIVATLYVGRDRDAADLTERDAELMTTLASQIAVAYESRRLFNLAQTERESLQLILNSLPTGVVVVNADSGQQMLTNTQAREMLGLDKGAAYQLVHTIGGDAYEEGELPIAACCATAKPSMLKALPC